MTGKVAWAPNIKCCWRWRPPWKINFWGGTHNRTHPKMFFLLSLLPYFHVHLKVFATNAKKLEDIFWHPLWIITRNYIFFWVYLQKINLLAWETIQQIRVLQFTTFSSFHYHLKNYAHKGKINLLHAIEKSATREQKLNQPGSWYGTGCVCVCVWWPCAFENKRSLVRFIRQRAVHLPRACALSHAWSCRRHAISRTRAQRICNILSMYVHASQRRAQQQLLCGASLSYTYELLQHTHSAAGILCVYWTKNLLLYYRILWPLGNAFAWWIKGLQKKRQGHRGNWFC